MHRLLRRNLYLLLLVILGAAGVQITVWIEDAIDERRTEPPVKVARQFLSALEHGDCDTALAYLSAAGRSAVEAQMREILQSDPPYVQYGPYSHLCWRTALREFVAYSPKTAQLASQAAGSAAVSVERHEGDPKSYLVPGFWPTRTIVTPVTMRLAEESGQWKVIVP